MSRWMAHNSKDGGGGDGGSERVETAEEPPRGPRYIEPSFRSVALQEGRYSAKDTIDNLYVCTYVRKSTCSTFIMVILGNLGNDVYYTLLVRVSGSLQSKVGEKIFFEIKEFVYKPFYTN